MQTKPATMHARTLRPYEGAGDKAIAPAIDLKLFR